MYIRCSLVFTSARNKAGYDIMEHRYRGISNKFTQSCRYSSGCLHSCVCVCNPLPLSLQLAVAGRCDSYTPELDWTCIISSKVACDRSLHSNVHKYYPVFSEDRISRCVAGDCIWPSILHAVLWTRWDGECIVHTWAIRLQCLFIVMIIIWKIQHTIGIKYIWSLLQFCLRRCAWTGRLWHVWLRGYRCRWPKRRKLRWCWRRGDSVRCTRNIRLTADKSVNLLVYIFNFIII